MRTKAKPIQRPAIPRSILPATANYIDRQQTIDDVQKEISFFPNPEYNQLLGVSRQQKNEINGTYHSNILKQMVASTLPVNSDGSTLTAKNIPKEGFSKDQRIAIRKRLRCALRLKLITRNGRLPERPTVQELDLWIKRNGLNKHQRSCQAFFTNIYEDLNINHKSENFEGFINNTCVKFNINDKYSEPDLYDILKTETKEISLKENELLLTELNKKLSGHPSFIDKLTEHSKLSEIPRNSFMRDVKSMENLKECKTLWMSDKDLVLSHSLSELALEADQFLENSMSERKNSRDLFASELSIPLESPSSIFMTSFDFV